MFCVSWLLKPEGGNLASGCEVQMEVLGMSTVEQIEPHCQDTNNTGYELS